MSHPNCSFHRNMLCIGNMKDSISLLTFSGTYVSKTLPPDLVYVAEEARAYALTKAKELKNQLCSDHPSFIKPISNYAATSSWLVKQEDYH